VSVRQQKRQETSASGHENTGGDTASSPLQAKLRGMDFAAGERALSPMGTSQDSAPVQRKDESGGVSKDGAIAEQVPENVSLEQVRVSARLPAGRTLGACRA
jgi:hypothetical protein